MTLGCGLHLFIGRLFGSKIPCWILCWIFIGTGTMMSCDCIEFHPWELFMIS